MSFSEITASFINVEEESQTDFARRFFLGIQRIQYFIDLAGRRNIYFPQKNEPRWSLMDGGT
jgi:hypothetical protein